MAATGQELTLANSVQIGVQMKIVALMMFLAGTFFLWIAFQIHFLKRRPYSLKLNPSLRSHGSHFGAFAAYYLACAIAAIYFSTLFYSGTHPKFIVIPAICALLVMWRQILLRGARKNFEKAVSNGSSGSEAVSQHGFQKI